MLDSSPEIKKMEVKLPPHFPEEIVEDILSRLAVELQLRFKCVSKSWYSLIGSKRFIRKHLEQGRKNRPFPFQQVIVMSEASSGLGQCSLQSLLNKDGKEPAPIDVVPTDNGLVCILGEEREILMWNPSTRAVRKLPRVGGDQFDDDRWTILKPVLGWDNLRDDYKVILFLCDRKANSTIGRLYSSDTDSWETLEHLPKVGFSYGDGQFVNGKFHWHSMLIENWRVSHVIVSFDSESGMFGMFGGPPSQRKDFRLAVVGKWLCAVILSWRIEVWIMKEYGVKESWQKLVAVDILPQLQTPFVVGPNGEILLLSASTFLVYCPKEGAFRPPGELPPPMDCITMCKV